MNLRILIALILILTVLLGCNPKAPVTPSPAQEATSPLALETPVSTPKVASPSLPPTTTNLTQPLPSTPTPEPSILPDLAWTGMPSVEPIDPMVGDKLHIRGMWKNIGAAATPPGFNIKLEIRQGNSSVFEQSVNVSQMVKPLEEGTLDVTPDYVISQPGSYQITLTLDPASVIAEAYRDNNVASANLVEVLDSPLFNKYPEDLAVLTQAKKDIETYRKGDVVITLLDSEGQPRSGLKVEYQQTSHSFTFDSNTGTGSEKVWSLLKEAGINYTMVDVFWSSVEPAPGDYQLGPERTFLLRRYNFAGGGRHLIWLHPSSTPDYISSLTFEEFKKAIYPHIYAVVNAYKQYVKRWTVFNEPMWQYANILGLNSEQEIEIIKEGTRAIREADQSARIEINNAVPGGEDPAGNPYDFLKEAVQSDVDFDVIGLQMYYNGSGYVDWPNISGKLFHFPRRTLASIGDLIDMYATLGKKINISELCLPSNNPQGNQGYWGQSWSPELQAEYLTAAYTLFFSKPQVEGIECAFVADSSAYQFVYYGGLFDEQNEPKKSYYALKRLIKSWTTTGWWLTDSDGKVSFRGFGGNYDVIITDPKTGLTWKREAIIKEQETNLVSTVID